MFVIAVLTCFGTEEDHNTTNTILIDESHQILTNLTNLFDLLALVLPCPFHYFAPILQIVDKHLELDI